MLGAVRESLTDSFTAASRLLCFAIRGLATTHQLGCVYAQVSSEAFWNGYASLKGSAKLSASALLNDSRRLPNVFGFNLRPN